jgi:hypothetical protein
LEDQERRSMSMTQWQTPDELDNAAARGAAELDRKLPGWTQMIDTDRLDVANSQACIVGQLLERGHAPWVIFDSQVGTSIVIGGGERDLLVEPAPFSWFVGDKRLAQYARLTESWIAQIQMRTGIPVTDTIHERSLVA